MVGIYKITNTITNQCYIGQSINIENRWKEHIRESQTLHRKTKFYLALNKYGPDTFKFEILEECPLDQEILNERECYWIEYYDSFKNGYNSTLGGQSTGKQIYDPQEIRDLWDKGYSIGEIAKMVGCSDKTIQTHLKGYNDYNIYTSCSRAAKHAIAEGTRSAIPVYQYDLNGQYITEYQSIYEAARKLGRNDSHSITRVLDHECQTAYGYQWSREKVESMPMVPMPRGKLIRCINTNQIFHSLEEAAKWCGLRGRVNIGNCCAGRNKTAGKHPETGERLKWEYVEA